MSPMGLATVARCAQVAVLALLLSATGACAEQESEPEPQQQPESSDADEDEGNHPSAPDGGIEVTPIPPAERVGSQTTPVSDRPLALTDVSTLVGLHKIGAQGVTFVDFDQDGWPDITATTYNGMQIFRNRGAVFVDETRAITSEDSETFLGATGLAWADVTGDGHLDLYVAIPRQADRMLISDGQGHLVLQPDDYFPGSTDTSSPSFADVDGDGWLDVYVAVSAFRPTLSGGHQGGPNLLLRNLEGTGFEDVTTAWGADGGSDSETFMALMTDFDRDGDIDAMVIRDFRSEQFFENSGTGFIDRSMEAMGPEKTSGMGLAVGDLNGDGHLDVYVSDIDGDILFQGDGAGAFKDVLAAKLVGSDPTNMKTWGCAIIDLDHDGDQDVISVAGSDSASHRKGGYALLENQGDGTLRDATKAVRLHSVVEGQGLAVADYDRDGDLDVLVALNDGIGTLPDGSNLSIQLLRNDSALASTRGFLQLRLRQPGPNVHAVGAIVDVEAAGRRAARVVTAGESYQSANWLTLHFGLGESTEADRVTIQWPGGPQQIARRVPAGAHRLTPFDGECCLAPDGCVPALPICPTGE
ncbi:MAG: hypothetical protein ACI9OJ_000361 [Myxococcota bacterium]